MSAFACKGAPLLTTLEAGRENDSRCRSILIKCETMINPKVAEISLIRVLGLRF